MKLFHLHRLNGQAGIDEARAFVVAARDEFEARELAADEAGDEGAAFWYSEATVAAKEIGTAGPDVHGVIVCDFRAGG